MRSIWHNILTVSQTLIVGLSLATPMVADEADDLLAVLASKAKTPQEKASVEIHQANLLRVFETQALLRSGLVSTRKEALLFRIGIVYSDFGKLGEYKAWLKNNREMLACLQNTNGTMWNESEDLQNKKPRFAPLMKLVDGSFLNPALDYEDIQRFFGAENEPFPGAGFKVPSYPMAIGYLHEVQGLFASYNDALDAIEKGQGPLKEIVTSMSDYRIIFETIFGHNGGGPNRESYEAWLKSARPNLIVEFGGTVPNALIPFWIQAREILTQQTEQSGIPMFKNTLIENEYVRPKSKYGYIHESTDRIDGIVSPTKISREVSFLGDREAFVNVYNTGNRFGSILLQEYIAQVELADAAQKGIIDAKDFARLEKHFFANRDMGLAVSQARLNLTDFISVDGNKIDSNQLPKKIQEVKRVRVRQLNGVTREFEFNEKSQLTTSDGSGESFYEFYDQAITNPVYEKVRKFWQVDQMQASCFTIGAVTIAGSMLQF